MTSPTPTPISPLFPATPPPPTPLQPQLLHSTLRIIVGSVFMLFGLGMGALIAWGFAISHEPITVIDGAFVGVPLILGFATAIPASFSFVISTVKPILPQWGRRTDDH